MHFVVWLVMNKVKKISILGCGWLGAPLGKSLVAQGYQVAGSVRTEDKKAHVVAQGINPFIVSCEPDGVVCNDPTFFNCDCLIISLPPGRKTGSVGDYFKRIQILLAYLASFPVKNIIYLSSTSVYSNCNAMVTEDSFLNPDTESGNAILNAENTLKKMYGTQLTVLRLAGLIGPGRDPIRFVDRVVDTKSGDTPINLIPQEECIRAVMHVLNNDLWGEVFNVVLEEHPTRSTFYGTLAQKRGLAIPQFKNMDQEAFKVVSGVKLKNSGLVYKYKNPIDYVQ